MSSHPSLPPSIASFIRTFMPAFGARTSGRRMIADIGRIVATDRWNSFDRFHDTTQTLVKAYESAGADAEIYGIQTGGPLGSGRWIIPEAADVRAVTVDIVAPVRRRLLDYRKCPWHVAQWSAATAPGGVRCELVIVDTDEQLARIKPGGLVGKMVLTRLKIAEKRREFYEKGAIGLLSDVPVADCPDAVAWTKFGWGGLPLADSRARLVGFALSGREGDRLRALIGKHGQVTVRANVDIRHYAGTHDMVSGIVRGRDDPQSEVWAVAHGSEPGALDNASGVAVCIEAARVLNRLAKSGVLPAPRRSIRFLHGYECYSFFHYLEHHERFQPPLAGICVDTVGARPDVCRGELRWHATVPSSAGFVNDVGEVLVRAALRRDNAGYRLLPKPFASTEDTLLADPKYGFPCPWLTNHPCRGYHSSADTLAMLHPRGLAVSAMAVAAYLYYLADAATGEALELAAWQTQKTVGKLREVAAKRGKGRGDTQAFVRQQHATNMERLKHWLWGGERSAILTEFAACERRVFEAGPAAQRMVTVGRGLTDIPRRTAPLAPTAENTWPATADKMKDLPRWIAYWADGRRTLAEIATLLSVELGRIVPADKLLQHFQALAELKYVELIPRENLISKAQVVRDLRALGVRPGMDVMVHSSLSRIGHIDGGAEAIVEALLTAIGKTGTLLMPSFNHFNARVFNALSTPTTNGAIPDAMWRRPDAVRTLHPSHAICAIGPKAAEWCEGHIENGIWSADSPIGRLIQAGGYVLSLGVDHKATTAYHLAEISLRCGCLDQFGSRDRIVTLDGRAQEVPGLAWRAGNCPVRIQKIDQTLDRRKLQVHGTVGNAPATLVLAKHVWATRREHVRKVCPTCGVKPERRATSDE